MTGQRSNQLNYVPKPPIRISGAHARFILKHRRLLEAKRHSEAAEAGESQLRLLPVNAGIIVPECPEPQLAVRANRVGGGLENRRRVVRGRKVGRQACC
jgi:hypothetical protein